MKKSLLFPSVVLVMMSFLPACAQKGPLLLEGVRYEAPEGEAAGASKTVVGVSPFKDDRGKTVSVLGKRTIQSSVENDLVVQGTVADLVTAALKDALKARGITVKDAPAWDVNADVIKSDGVDVLIGGEIKTLWVDVLSQPLNVKVSAEVRLRVAAADAAEKKVVRTLVLNSKMERQDMAFSFDTTAGALSEALSSALNQLLNDDGFKSRIK